MDKIDDVRLVGLVIALAGLVVAGVSILSYFGAFR
jgi:hypothetical protein